MIHFWAERCWKYALSQKNLKLKVFRHRIFDKKVHEGISGLGEWQVHILYYECWLRSTLLFLLRYANGGNDKNLSSSFKRQILVN